MNFYVYINYSSTLDRYYCGFSQFTSKRVRQHCKGKTYWTSRADDWEQVWKKEVPSRAEARQLEEKIKGRGIKRFLEEVGVPPEAG